MDADQGIFVPLFLGIIEGLTEFLPVSSTGHLLLAGHFLGFNSPGRTFEVLIQLGAILAIMTIYLKKLLAIARDALAGDRNAWRFILCVVAASFPAALAGVLLHDFIKTVLYESPLTICIALIAGGVILLFIDQMKLAPRYTDTYAIPPLTALLIGLFQMLALVPGVSRSGATIVGSMLLGVEKRAAAEFTFFIALPIMTGAFGYDLYKNRELIGSELGLGIAIGFAAAFLVGALVVRYLLDFVSKHGFAPFAYWRIFVGALGLWGILLFG
jgi:undecaprenyl-diphosphatase